MRRLFPYLVALIASTWAVGCGDETSTSNDAGSAPPDAQVDAGPSDQGVADTGARPDLGFDPDQEPSDLGRICAGSCNLATCVLASDMCQGGICVWHEERGGAYCSRRCAVTCAPGYQCLPTADESGPACLSNPAVCGNGTVEFGEACDDGNTAAGDFCAPDCLMETVPPSGGTVRIRVNGGEERSVTGVEPEVFAERQGDNFFFGGTAVAFDLRLALTDNDGPAPYRSFLEAGLIENAGGNICSFSGATLA
ncbi:MAG: hypothetical protein AAFU79_22740, partial [Myxococcota bacterium]